MSKTTSPKPENRNNLLFWLAVTITFFVFIYLIRNILLPFVLAAATAYFLDPAADKLQKWGLSRTSATVLITAFATAFVIAVLVLAVPVLAGQLSGILEAIPTYVAQFRQEVLPLIEQKLRVVSPTLVHEIESSITSSTGLIARGVTDFFGNALTSGIALINVVSLILITPIVSFYLIRDWDRLVEHVDSLLPRRHADVIRQQCRIIDNTLAGFVRGTLNVCLLLGIYYAIGLSLLGLNFGFIIGFVTGFLVIFPYVGLLVGALVGLMVAFFQFGDLQNVLLVLGVFVTGQLIESNFVTPKLVGDKVGLHPVWIIFAMLVGGTLFGFVGILLAVPLAAVLGVLVRFATERYQESGYFQ